MTQREFALQVTRRLQDSGYRALWAGGCVRDQLLGQTPTDYDIVTDARPERVRKLFERTVAVGEAFGVIKVIGRGQEVDVATFRTEGPYTDGRHPDRVEFSTPEADARRRDFTINGMFYDPVRDTVLDFVGGQADLQAGLVRAIGDPTERFLEDKLRLLRAVRFAARFGFTIDPQTEAALIRLAPQVIQVSPERIQQELRRMLTHRSRVEALRLADRLGLLAAILPEVMPMKALEQHKPAQPTDTLWDHSLRVLGLLDSPSFPLALAALLHDVGKPATLRRHGPKVTFHDHEHVGRAIADAIGVRLRLSNRERDRVDWLVEFHQYLGQAKQLRESKLKRILIHPGIGELLALHRADALASTGNTEHIDYCEAYLRQTPSEQLNPPPLLTGHDLVRAGLTPGPQFSRLLERVRDGQLEGRLRTKREALAFAQELARDETVRDR